MKPWIVAVVTALGVTIAVTMLRKPEAGTVELSGPVRRDDSAAAEPTDSSPIAIAKRDATTSNAAPATATPRYAAIAPAAPEPRYAQPAEIENLLWQFIAEQPGLEVVNISAVECTPTSCEIALTPRQGNPRFAAAYNELHRKVLGQQWSDFRFVSGGVGSREIAPGVHENVMSFEYQPMQELSDDSAIAARQHAACAAAWRRLTENPTPSDVARQYLDQEAQRLALAASVLGEDEARRIAAEARGRGPVLRDCFRPVQP